MSFHFSVSSLAGGSLCLCDDNAVPLRAPRRAPWRERRDREMGIGWEALEEELSGRGDRLRSTDLGLCLRSGCLPSV